MGLGMGFPTTREARAAAPVEVGYEFRFKETLVTAGAVGTILGASTLPFYGQPGTHLLNVGYGAAAGLLVGTGIWVFNRIWSSNSNSSSAVLDLPIHVSPGSFSVSFVSLTW